jgi:hypothetical protein
MKKLLIAGLAAIAIAASALPVAAEVYPDPGPGIGVQVGPFAAGVGPGYGWHDPYWRNGHYAYGYSDCRVVRERTVTPSGRVIIEHRRICN